ncbi:hypothetical protein GCM10018954_037620 [Kutzneria kofuensis]
MPADFNSPGTAASVSAASYTEPLTPIAVLGTVARALPAFTLTDALMAAGASAAATAAGGVPAAQAAASSAARGSAAHRLR